MHLLDGNICWSKEEIKQNCTKITHIMQEKDIYIKNKKFIQQYTIHTGQALQNIKS